MEERDWAIRAINATVQNILTNLTHDAHVAALKCEAQIATLKSEVARRAAECEWQMVRIARGQ